jgi:6,7-dimethyl-8-ribityllumazine synthase
LAGLAPNRTPVQKGDLQRFRIGILYSSWHEKIISRLLEGTRKALLAHGFPEERTLFYQVPGSFELPLAADWLLDSKRVDGIICLGCVVKGETQHDEFISHAINKSFLDLSLKYSRPVMNGVLTTLNEAQAKARSGGKKGNKGEECVHALIDMLTLEGQIKNIPK